MAITRAQQAKQLLANGGRIGLFLGGNFKGGYSESRKDSGAKRGPRDDPDRFGPSNKPTSSSTNREKGMMSRYEGPGGTTGNITNFKDRPPEDKSSERQTYNTKVATGRLFDEDYENANLYTGTPRTMYIGLNKKY